MDKKLMIQFLTKEAIKTQTDSKHKDRIWAAIRKAHRDVMTGARTGNIKNYVEENKNGKNKTTEYLYQKIKRETPLSSLSLIEKIQELDSTVEFAAIQKLVNMTLKYLIILNEFEKTDLALNICEEKCDCPVDSIILEKLSKINGIKHECWTKMEETEYKNVQNEIQEYLKNEYPNNTYGNIWFDFLMWKVD